METGAATFVVLLTSESHADHWKYFPEEAQPHLFQSSTVQGRISFAAI